MDVSFPILTYLVFLPVVGAILTYALGASDRVAKWTALVFSLLVLALGTILLLGLLWPASQGGLFRLPVTRVSSPTPNNVQTYYAMEKLAWVPQVNVNYMLGADELSVVLVFLNTLLAPLALAFSWDEHHRTPEFFAMFLLMEATVNGVFLSLDLFQFMIFWEVGLIPMYFIIAVWGGPRRKYASIKFFMYTFLASLPLLVGI